MCVCVCVGVYKSCERVYMVNMVWEEVRNISYTTGKHYFKKQLYRYIAQILQYTTVGTTTTIIILLIGK